MEEQKTKQKKKTRKKITIHRRMEINRETNANGKSWEKKELYTPLQIKSNGRVEEKNMKK